jgi:cof-like hydrolase
MIKAVFIDIDETLTNSQREVTEKTKLEIKKCVENGVKIILTSGRSRREAMDFQEQIGTSPYIVSSNGASAYDAENGVEIYNERIDPQMVLQLIKHSRENGYRIKLNYKDLLVMNEAAYPDEKDKEVSYEELERVAVEEQVVQCVITSTDFEKMRFFRDYIKNECVGIAVANESKRFKNPDLKPSRNYYCDVASVKVSKGNAVKAVCEYFEIKPEEIVTIGDGENDLSMLGLTPNSVAMGNSLPEIKEKANYVTASNDEDGVAKVLGFIIKVNEKEMPIRN